MPRAPRSSAAPKPPPRPRPTTPAERTNKKTNQRASSMEKAAILDAGSGPKPWCVRYWARLVLGPGIILESHKEADCGHNQPDEEALVEEREFPPRRIGLGQPSGRGWFGRASQVTTMEGFQPESGQDHPGDDERVHELDRIPNPGDAGQLVNAGVKKGEPPPGRHEGEQRGQSPKPDQAALEQECRARFFPETN